MQWAPGDLEARALPRLLAALTHAQDSYATRHGNETASFQLQCVLGMYTLCLHHGRSMHLAECTTAVCCGAVSNCCCKCPTPRLTQQLLANWVTLPMVRLLGPTYTVPDVQLRDVPLPKGLEHVPNPVTGAVSWLLVELVSFLVRDTALVNMPTASTRTTYVNVLHNTTEGRRLSDDKMTIYDHTTRTVVADTRMGDDQDLQGWGLHTLHVCSTPKHLPVNVANQSSTTDTHKCHDTCSPRCSASHPYQYGPATHHAVLTAKELLTLQLTVVPVALLPEGVQLAGDRGGGRSSSNGCARCELTA